MEYTGERFMPGVPGEIALEHYQRYMFAKNFVAGKKVLDLASGEGYGSYLLSEAAESVIGVDVDKEARDHAASKYKRATLEYQTADCTDLSGALSGRRVDVVVFFEALEHITAESQARTMREIKSVLKEDGILIISTPNKPVYEEASGSENTFHLHELSLEEFRELLGCHFKHIQMFGQKAEMGSFLWPFGHHGSRIAATCNLLADKGPVMAGPLPPSDRAQFFIAVCSDGDAQCSAKLEVMFHEDMKELINLRKYLEIKHQELREKEVRIQLLDTYIKDMHESSSWRLTAPLRGLMEIFKGLSGRRRRGRG